MKNKINNIKATWTYRNLSRIIIIGLVLGIYIESQGGLDILIPVEASKLTYTQEKEEIVVCDLDCEIEERTHRIFEENKNTYMEQARLDALVEMRDVLIGKIGDSPYYDYEYMGKKYSE